MDRRLQVGSEVRPGLQTIDLSDMKVKADWEFGPEGAVQRMLDIRDFRISVMNRPFSGDANMFNMSIATVIEHFPAALEVVVVVTESDISLLEGIANPYRASATFPLRVLGEPELMNGGVQKMFFEVRCCTDLRQHTFNHTVQYPHQRLKVVTSSRPPY